MTTPDKVRLSANADLDVSPIGFGGMALSHVYGGGLTSEAARDVIDQAIDAGITFIDTADIYGEPRPGTEGPAGTNEEMLAPLLARRRGEVQFATKFGITGAPLAVDGARAASRGVDGSPEYVRSAADASLRRLGIDTIDLYYLHRPDPQVPIEETVGAMAELVEAGKVRQLGLSEVTSDELRRAHATHPITAVQSEWSLWSRDVEAHVVPACAELGVGFVPYSPLGRGFLTGTLTKEQVADDFRSQTARMGAGWDDNAEALSALADVASETGASQAQVALAWLRAKGQEFGLSVVPIPGSRTPSRMIQNLGCVNVELSAEQMMALDSIAGAVSGSRNIVDNPDWISANRE